MPALKAILKSLEGLADPIKALYKQEGDDFHIDVEGMVPKSQLDQFRDNNRELNRELTETKETLKKFDGVDLKKIAEMQETERKVKDGELIKAGRFDELFESKINPIVKKHQEEREADKKEKERLTSQLSRVMIDQELTKIATAKGLRPEAISDMLWRLRPEFSVVGDKVVSLDEKGIQRRTDSGEPYTLERSIEGLAKSAAHLFNSSSGGGAQQNTNTNKPGGKTMTRAEYAKLDPQAARDFTGKDGGIVVDA